MGRRPRRIGTVVMVVYHVQAGEICLARPPSFPPSLEAPGPGGWLRRRPDCISFPPLFLPWLLHCTSL